jgi:ABC-type multidrug transport system permease subunit
MTPDTAPPRADESAPPGADAVACTGLTYAFGDHPAVDGLDLTVRQGEVFGLLGPNGAGKTTAVAAIVVLGSAFFSCLSMTIAGIVLSRDRLMGIGQAITMPLFFGSSAHYPVSVMPHWLQAVSTANPLSYEVDALRGLLLGTPHHLASDFAVLFLAAALGITAASAPLGRLAR